MCCIQLTSSSATNIALVSLLPQLCPTPGSLHPSILSEVPAWPQPRARCSPAPLEPLEPPVSPWSSSLCLNLPWSCSSPARACPAATPAAKQRAGAQSISHGSLWKWKSENICRHKKSLLRPQQGTSSESKTNVDKKHPCDAPASRTLVSCSQAPGKLHPHPSQLFAALQKYWLVLFWLWRGNQYFLNKKRENDQSRRYSTGTEVTSDRQWQSWYQLEIC